MTARFRCRFVLFWNFLLGWSPLYPRAFTTSDSQVCAAVWFCSGAKQASQYNSQWLFKPYVLCLHIHKWLPSCSQTINIGFYLSSCPYWLHLHVWIYLCWNSSYYCTRLWHLEQNFCHCIFWNILAPFKHFKTTLFSLLGSWPKSKLDNYPECPILEIWIGASIFAFFFVSLWAKQRQISINWN